MRHVEVFLAREVPNTQRIRHNLVVARTVEPDGSKKYRLKSAHGCVLDNYG